MCQVMQNSLDDSLIWKIALDELDFYQFQHIPLLQKIKANLTIINEDDKHFHLYPSPEQLNQLQLNNTSNPD